MSTYTAGRLVEIVQSRGKGLFKKNKSSIYLYCKEQDTESVIRRVLSKSVLASDGSEDIAGVVAARIFKNLKDCEFISSVHAPEPEPGSDVFVVDVPNRRVGVWQYEVRYGDHMTQMEPNPGSWVSYAKFLNW